VNNVLLTGFDTLVEQVLLILHDLLQAIARINRISEVSL
jgi:type I site-specific restriction-modification system R (restriction) subunit